MPSRAAVNKKMRKRFRAGDVITWGLGAKGATVLDVEEDGVTVDATQHMREQDPTVRTDLTKWIIKIWFDPPSKSHRGPPRLLIRQPRSTPKSRKIAERIHRRVHRLARNEELAERRRTNAPPSYVCVVAQRRSPRTLRSKGAR